MARVSKVNASIAFNILRTLVSVGFVMFDPQTKTYKLGNGMLKLSERLLGQSIVDAIRPSMVALAETDSLVALWQVTGDRLVSIDQAASASPIRLELAVKKNRMPLMTGALGRALAATLGLSDRKMRAEFTALRWEEPITATRYVEDVREAERLGYGVDRGLPYSGVISIGAVIRDRADAPVYGLTASTISDRINEDQIGEIGDKMVHRRFPSNADPSSGALREYAPRSGARTA